MKQLKTLALAAVAALALVALGAGTSSATELYKYTTPSPNDTLGAGTELVLSIESGTSMLLKDTLGGSNDTCSSSEIKTTIESAGGISAHPSGKVGHLTLGGCSHTSDTLATGELEIRQIAGTTNGTLISKGARVTFKSTIFGVSCILNTGAGTTIGTLTGAKGTTTAATADINGVVTLENGCGDSIWTGSYSVTGTPGLTVEAS